MRSLPVWPRRAEGLAGKIGGGDETGPQSIVDVVVDVGDAVGEAHHPALEGGGKPVTGVTADAVANLPGEVETPALMLQRLDHAHALFVVLEPAGAFRPEDVVEDGLAGVAEGSVTEIVAQRHGLHQVFVQTAGPGYGAGDARDLQRVGETGAVVVAFRRDEDLSLVLEPPERLAVHDAVAIALVGGAQSAGLLGVFPSARRRRALRPPREARLEDLGGQAYSARALVLHALTGLAGAPGCRGAPRQPCPCVRRPQSPTLPEAFSSNTACAAARRARGTR